MKNLLRAGALALAWLLAPIAAMAASTTSVTVASSTYTDLGAGPLFIQTPSFDVWLCIADSKPGDTDTCFTIGSGQAFQTTSHVWARAANGNRVITTAALSPNVGGYSVIAGGSFSRPDDTTAYALGDLVANSTTAGSVTPISVAVARINGGSGMIRRVRLSKTNTSTTNASFRVHFYKSSPTVTNGDNGAWLSTQSTYLGAVDITMDKVFSDAAKGIGTPNTGSEIVFDTNTSVQTIYALIEARAAYTPASGETFTLAVEALQD